MARKKKPTRKARKPDGRHIFTFKVAGRKYRVDPLEALICLRDHEQFDWEADPAAADRGDGPAIARTMQAIKDAFGLKGLKDGGGTITERLAVLVAFSNWCDVQKKTAEPLPIVSPISDSPPNDSTTESLSESTSTEIGSCCGEVSPSVSEPAAP